MVDLNVCSFQQQANIRNQKKMDKMREKLHTDDECELWRVLIIIARHTTCV